MAALRFTDFRCFILHLATAPEAQDRGRKKKVILVELFQEFGIALRNLSVDLKARVGPPSDPFTVMKVRVRGSSVTRVGFVIASTGAERARPAFAAISLVRDVVPGQEIGLGSPVYAVFH